MADYAWPDKANSSVIGKPFTKLDAIVKSTGKAKYAYDATPDKMLLARALGCPQAHCRIKSIDFSAAEKVPGVVKVAAAGSGNTQKKVGSEIRFQGDLIAYVVGESEGAVGEGLAAIKVEYEPLDVFVNDEDLEAAQKAGRARSGVTGAGAKGLPEGKEAQDEALAKLLAECAAVVKGHYGCHGITHDCLEPHGTTCEWKDNKLTAWLSSQAIYNAAGEFSGPLGGGMTREDVTAICDYIGGGFGSKFSADYWCVDAARLAREIGRPVKLMLDRDTEVKIAGGRPSGYADVTIGADKDGLIKVWDSYQWSTPGSGGAALPAAQIPYVFDPPVRRRGGESITTNVGPSRAWRAPNHPQSCLISQTAIDDIAAKLGLNSYDVFLKNLAIVGGRAKLYEEEMKIGAEAMDWKAKWHPHGKGTARGSIVSGLGMSLHTWGGGGQRGACRVNIHPDGGLEVFIATQDVGSGTRTIIGMVTAETFGLPVEAVKVNIGNSKYPQSGASGGSATMATVSESSRRASCDALDQLKEKVAAKVGVDAANLVAKGGRIQDKSDASKGLSWKDACGLLGMTAIDVQASGSPGRGGLSSQGVGGVQMAEVEVDRETGVIRMKKFVAVQDCGLIVNPKTATSQINGAMIMGICSALFEERILDHKTGAFVNAECADYKLARLGDIGEFVVKLYEPESERARGVIGLGEPPTVGPMAAISNAVCNALGVRVPVLPMTPQRVLEALKARPV